MGQASHKDFGVFEEVPRIPTVGRGLPARVACPGLATGLAFKGLVITTLWLWERKRLNSLQGRLKNHIIGGTSGGIQADRHDKEHLMDTGAISYPSQCYRSF